MKVFYFVTKGHSLQIFAWDDVFYEKFLGWDEAIFYGRSVL